MYWPLISAKQSRTNKLANNSARVLAGKSFLRLVAILVGLSFDRKSILLILNQHYDDRVNHGLVILGSAKHFVQKSQHINFTNTEKKNEKIDNLDFKQIRKRKKKEKRS